MFNEQGLARDDVLEQLDALLQQDSTYQTGQPVASMSTIPHSLGVDVFSRTLEKNAGRLHTFKGSAMVEKELINMIGDLLKLTTPYGTTTSGGTESNILAMLAARESYSKVKKPEAIAPLTAHASIDKAAWLLGIKLIKTEVDDEYKADPTSIENAMTKNTIAIFSTAGSTYLGQVDPISEIGKIAKQHELPFHVDAAFGGFVIPFLNDLGYNNLNFDFKVEGVTSMSTDPHKMGLAPIPSGCILFREQQHLKKITREIPYLQGESSTQASILGTRPAASILAAWAIMKHLGREGYRNLVEICMKRTKLALERIYQNPILSSAIEPIMNIIGVEYKQGQIQQVVDEMEKRGWSMATSPDPLTLRLVIMPHVNESAIHSFFDDLDGISKMNLVGH